MGQIGGDHVPGRADSRSKHYDDLLPLWIEGQDFPLSFYDGGGGLT